MDTSTNNKVFIGRYGTTYSDGKIADARIYDAELSSTDVSDIYNGTNVTTNLIGHWLTNNDDVDDYAGTNDGTNFGSTYSYDNPNALVEYGGASRGFDAGVTYIDLGDSDDYPTGSQTWCCWLKLNTVYGLKTQVSKNNDTNNQRGARIRTNGGVVQIYISPDGSDNWTSVFSNTTLSQDTWYHVAFTFNSSTHLKIYIDGVEDNSNTTNIPASIYDNTASLLIGALNDPVTQLHNGKIADVRIYDTDLSSTEVYELYKGVDHRTNLIGQWLTNSDDVEDKAGTNDGTNNGSTYSTDSPL